MKNTTVRILRKKTSLSGNPQVTLIKDGKRKTFNVADLVCEAFHGPRPPGKVARHKNNDLADNRAVNLEWGDAE